MGCGPSKEKEQPKEVCANAGKDHGQFTVANIAESLVSLKDSGLTKLTEPVKVVITSNGKVVSEVDAPVAEGKYAIKKKVNVDIADLGAADLVDLSPGADVPDYDIDVFNLSVIVLPTDTTLTKTALFYMHHSVENHEFTLVLDADSGLDPVEVATFVAKSDALLSGALTAHMILFPRLHFARVLKKGQAADVRGKVLTAAIFGDSEELSAFDEKSVAGGSTKRWDYRASVHTYVGCGLEDGEIVEHWEKSFKEWRNTLWAGEADMEVSLVVDTGLFDKFQPAEIDAEYGMTDDGMEEAEAASNFEELKSEAAQYANAEDEADEEDEEAAAEEDE
jgi:hypothetical protein